MELSFSSIGIFAHSSCAKASSSLMFDGLRAATAFFKSHQRFSVGFKSGDREGHSRTFQDLFLNQALIDLAVYLGSLSCWRVQWSPRFNFSTEGITFLLKMARYFWESMMPDTWSRFPVCATEKTSPHHQWLTSMFDDGDGILLVWSHQTRKTYHILLFCSNTGFFLVVLIKLLMALDDNLDFLPWPGRFAAVP